MFLYCGTALPQIKRFQENGVKKQMVSSKKSGMPYTYAYKHKQKVSGVQLIESFGSSFICIGDVLEYIAEVVSEMQ